MVNVVFGRLAAMALVSTSLSVPTAASAAAVCQAADGSGQAGCVLPLGPRLAAVQAPVVAPPVSAAPVVAAEVSRGFPFLILGALAAAAAILAIVLVSDSDNDPVSP